jgi:hypothetical protein
MCDDEDNEDLQSDLDDDQDDLDDNDTTQDSNGRGFPARSNIYYVSDDEEGD